MGSLRLCTQCLKNITSFHTRRYSTKKQTYASKLKSKHSVWLLQSTNIYDNLAVEDWLYKYQDFDGKTLLLLWRNDPCVVIGRHQNPWEELDVTMAIQDKVAIARRSSGGGTVYHDKGNMCMSIFTQRDKYNRKKNLELLCTALTQKYSIDVSINDRDDLLLNKNYKISGTAAKLGVKVAYHHFTLLLNVDKAYVHKLLHSPIKGLSSNATESVRSDIMNLMEADKTISYEGVCDSIIQEYYTGADTQILKIDNYEAFFPGYSEIREEIKSWKWIFGKTPSFKLQRSFQGLLGHIQMILEVDMQIDKGKITQVSLSLTGAECAVSTCEIFSEQLRGVAFDWHDVDDVIKNIHSNQTLFERCDDLAYSWIAMCLNELFY